MAEIELQVLNVRYLNRHISTLEKVKEVTKAWKKHRNNLGRSINWQFTNTNTRVKLKRLYQSFHS